MDRERNQTYVQVIFQPEYRHTNVRHRYTLLSLLVSMVYHIDHVGMPVRVGISCRDSVAERQYLLVVLAKQVVKLLNASGERRKANLNSVQNYLHN